MAETEGRSWWWERWQRSWKGPFRNAPSTALARYGTVKDPAAQRIRPTPTPTEAQPGNRPTHAEYPRPATLGGMKLLGFGRFLEVQEGTRSFTPLCPAGHLPLKGGDRQEALSSLHSQTSRGARHRRRSISPLEGEMPGRAEGGKPHAPATSRKPHPVTNPSDSYATD